MNLGLHLQVLDLLGLPGVLLVQDHDQCFLHYDIEVFFLLGVLGLAAIAILVGFWLFSGLLLVLDKLLDATTFVYTVPHLWVQRTGDKRFLGLFFRLLLGVCLGSLGRFLLQSTFFFL